MTENQIERCRSRGAMYGRVVLKWQHRGVVAPRYRIVVYIELEHHYQGTFDPLEFYITLRMVRFRVQVHEPEDFAHASKEVREK